MAITGLPIASGTPMRISDLSGLLDVFRATGQVFGANYPEGEFPIWLGIGSPSGALSPGDPIRYKHIFGLLYIIQSWADRVYDDTSNPGLDTRFVKPGWATVCERVFGAGITDWPEMNVPEYPIVGIGAGPVQNVVYLADRRIINNIGLVLDHVRSSGYWMRAGQGDVFPVCKGALQYIYGARPDMTGYTEDHPENRYRTVFDEDPSNLVKTRYYAGGWGWWPLQMTASYKYTDQYTPERWTLNVETPAYHPVKYRLLRTNRAAISFKIGIDDPSVTPEFTITGAAIGLEGYTKGSYADWVEGVYTNVPYDCGGGELSFGVTKWTDPPDWYGGYDDIASLSATGAGAASLPYELAESWASVTGSSLFGNAENLLAIQFQDNTFDDAFHWNYIRGSLDPGSPYYDDTVASGKARRAGQVVGPGWFQFGT